VLKLSGAEVLLLDFTSVADDEGLFTGSVDYTYV
jgi:hypothetical protein